MPFLTPFVIQQISDDLFELKEDLIYLDEKFSKTAYVEITVPKGFVSDGPSVPRIPLAYMICGNRGKRAGVVHDYLYRNKILNREEDDKIFLDCLLESPGINKFQAYMMYYAVRLFGEKHRKTSREYCLNTYYDQCTKKCDDCHLHDHRAITNIRFIPITNEIKI